MTSSGGGATAGEGGEPDAGADRLPCGAAVAGLFEQVAEGRQDQLSAHQASCPHCRAALAELSELWAPVRALAAERVSAPAGLITAIMSRVRELARELWYAVLPDDRGSTRIAARVIGAIARRSAGGVPGVRVALGRSTEPAQVRAARRATEQHAYPGTAVGVAGGQLVVDLALAVAYDLPIPQIAGRVQRAVIAEIRALTGVPDIEVNVTVDDVIVG